MGFDECSGDALTFKIATEDMKQVLTRSVVCPTDNIKHRNIQVTIKKDVKDKLEKQDIVGESLLHPIYKPPMTRTSMPMMSRTSQNP